MKTVIMSDLYPCFCRELEKRGYNIIPSKNINEFIKPEQKHADMQVLRINNKLFTLENCAKIAGKKYPENVLLNCLFLNNTLYGRLDSTDNSVIDYCMNNDIRLVNVNQGYTRCSTLAINNKAVITADKGIKKTLKNNGVEVLLIKPGFIKLDGFDYGFIGGASFCDSNKVFFFGNIEQHPDYSKIKKFIHAHNSKIEVLCKNMIITDIGGAVITD